MQEKKVNILVVDDQPANIFALESILRKSGYGVISTSSGREALDKIEQEEDIAVILMDVHMPEMNGFEATEKIKQTDKGKHIPVIFVSAAYIDDDSIFQGYEAGGFDYLTKPFSPQLLRSKIEIFVKLFKKEKQIFKINRDLQYLVKQVDEMKKKIDSQEQHRKHLISQLVQFSFHNSELTQAHAEMMKKYEQVENENDLLQQQLSDFLKDLNQANQSIAILKWQVDQ
ncbi:MAG: response regulator [SAR324 cluster bacterium]|nr:response regulator [SAR324 cluster bacterium]